MKERVRERTDRPTTQTERTDRPTVPVSVRASNNKMFKTVPHEDVQSLQARNVAHE